MKSASVSTVSRYSDYRTCCGAVHVDVMFMVLIALRVFCWFIWCFSSLARVRDTNAGLMLMAMACLPLIYFLPALYGKITHSVRALTFILLLLGFTMFVELVYVLVTVPRVVSSIFYAERYDLDHEITTTLTIWYLLIVVFGLWIQYWELNVVRKCRSFYQMLSERQLLPTIYRHRSHPYGRLVLNNEHLTSSTKGGA